MPYLGIFCWNFKRVWSCLKPNFSNMSNTKICCRKNALNLIPKIIDLGCFGVEFKTEIFIFEISVLECA